MMVAAMVGRGGLRKVRGAAAAVVAAGVLAAGLAAPAAAQAPGGSGFGDVAEGVWYRDAVEALARSGVFSGTECAQGFCGGELIDRYTMAVWIVRVVDGEDPAPAASTRFADVDAAGTYGRFVERLAALGVTDGCGDGSRFCGEDTVSRAEMAVFLSRAFELPEGADAGFSDVAAGAWYRDAANRLAASGVTAGCGDGTRFCGDADTTRAEIATFLARASGAVPKPEPRAPALRLLSFEDRYTVPAELQGTGADFLSLSPDEGHVAYFDSERVIDEESSLSFRAGRLSVANADGTGLNHLSDNAIGLDEFCDGGCGTDVVTTWSPDGRHILYLTADGALFTAAADGTSTVKLADGLDPSYTSIDYNYEWSPDGGRIAYLVYDGDTGYNTGKRELFTAEPDGGNIVKLTDSLKEFIWSPDGGRIAYATYDSDAPRYAPQYALFTAAPDGADVVKLTESTHVFGWSPDGGRIAYSIYDQEIRQAALFTAAPDGADVVKLTDNLLGPSLLDHNVYVVEHDNPYLHTFIWSPDGGRIYYETADREWFTAAADGTSIVNFPASPGRFSPDGGRIAYSVYDSDTGQRALFTAAADGAGATRITQGGPHLDYLWSPDSRHIAVRQTVETDWDHTLFTAAADGTSVTRLNEIGRNGRYRWSHDGRHIFYTVYNSDTRRDEWFTAAADGTSTTTIALADDEYYVVQSPDGGHIAYTTSDGALFTAAADGTGTTKVTDLTHGTLRLIPPDDGNGPSSFVVWSPDGSRFAYVIEVTAGVDPGVSRFVVEVFGVGGENPVTLGMRSVVFCPGRVLLTWRPNGVELHVEYSGEPSVHPEFGLFCL